MSGWRYNSAGLLSEMIYPAGNQGTPGERVTFDYHPQMSLDSVLGAFPQPYVYTTEYDAAGRVVERRLGVEAVVTQYNYYDWTSQGGRLQQMTGGTPGDPDGLQDLRYTYDAMGNVSSIQDYLTGAPQTQSFAYDALYRLTSAGASGGSLGDYGPEAYSYDPTTGNLASKAGVGYTYGNAQHAHAVTSLSNGNSYQYDANGNMTQRNVGGTPTTCPTTPRTG